MAINQVIYCVREGPFSIEFMTCCKKQMLQRYWKFAGYIIIWCERATVKDEGQCFIMIPLPVYMSRWGDPIGRCRGLWWNLYYIDILSHDYSPRIMFWYSDSHITNGAAWIIWHFPVIENKVKIVMKRHNKNRSKLFHNWLFSIKTKQNKKDNLFWLQSFHLPDIEVFVSFMADCWKMGKLFPCRTQMLIDLVECQQAVTNRGNRGQELVWICPFLLTLQLID